MGNIYEPGTISKVFTKFSSIKQDGSRGIKLCLMVSSQPTSNINSRTSVTTFPVSIRQDEQDYLWEIYTSLKELKGSVFRFCCQLEQDEFNSTL